MEFNLRFSFLCYYNPMSEFLENREIRTSTLLELARKIINTSLTKENWTAAKPWIESSTPEDVAILVDAIIGEAHDFSALKSKVAATLNLFKSSLEPYRYHEFPVQERFLSSLVAENLRAATILNSLRPLIQLLAKNEDDDISETAAFTAKTLIYLQGIERHFIKKEQILFPRFEAAFPQFRCVRLMWSIHNDIRTDLKRFLALVSGNSRDKKIIAIESGKLFFDFHAMFFREECILFPLMSSLFPAQDLESMYQESLQYGFSFLTENDLAKYKDFKAVAFQREKRIIEPVPSMNMDGADTINLACGYLPAKTVSLLLKSLPGDITFVDATDTVRFFSDGTERVFPRNPSIIGRKVSDCHPRESVETVMAILRAFKDGSKDREEFWLEMRGRFIHIEYRALRDGDGGYMGTIEISEDLTAKRALAGEKRLVLPSDHG